MAMAATREPSAASADSGGAVALDLPQAPGGLLRVRLGGTWSLGTGIPPLDSVRAAIAKMGPSPKVAVETDRLGAWDSALVTFVLSLVALCAERGAALDLKGLPDGLRRLVTLATAVPERKDAVRSAAHLDFVIWAGTEAIKIGHDARRTMHFVGEVAIAFGRFLQGRASFRGRDLLLYMQECGAQALPIVTVISLLLGLIMAFVGAVQLQKFGADIYVANLVVIAMSREMSAVMTGIVLSGRTGAAYAAQIGAMQGNEEIDALATLGISPIEFLVLPRMLALLVMMPLLCIYSNLMGLIGGYFVSVGMLNVTGPAFVHQTVHAAHLSDFAIGIAKSAVFGMIVAIAGCLKGIQSGRSAAAVGDAATSAVVAAILYIIVFDGFFAVVLNFLGI